MMLASALIGPDNNALVTEGELVEGGEKSPLVGSGLVPAFTLQTAAFYTTSQIARELNIPERHVIGLVRESKSPLHGRKIGKQYVISGEEFQNYVSTGKFEYKPRQPRAVQFANAKKRRQ